MSLFNKLSGICVCEQTKEVNVGKIIFKTVAVTAAVLAFVPTVFKINKGKGFDGYGMLSHVKYEKSTDENGKPHHDISVTLIDLSRYGVKTKKADEEEKNEDSISIEE